MGSERICVWNTDQGVVYVRAFVSYFDVARFSAGRRADSAERYQSFNTGVEYLGGLSTRRARTAAFRI